MKKALAIIVLLAAVSLQAQITTNQPAIPTSPANIVQTTIGWLSDLDTNMPTFTGNKAMLWTGASSIQGGPVSLVNDIGLSYDVFQVRKTNSSSIFYVAPEALMRSGGVSGTVVSWQAGVGAGVILYDLRIGLYADGGSYVIGVNKDQSKIYGEVGLRVMKGLGAHFAAGVGVGAQFPDNRQVFSALVSANF